MKTAIAIKIMLAVMGTLKVFRKKAIIAMREETIIMANKISKKSSATSLERRKKYIQINSNALISAQEKRKTLLARAQRK